MKEGMAGGWALLQAKQDANANALVKAVADDLAAGEGRTLAREHVQTLFTGARVSDVKERAIGELRNVAAVLDTKAPADAMAFKAWLREIAQKAAEAAKEGGFLGFGGVAVSDAERATLTEISSALNTGAAV